MKNISKTGLLSLLVPKVDIAFQNRFADFVRQADKSKFELQRTIDELEVTYKSLLRENLG
jgi:type I restriction enzyme S subunit